MRSILVLLVTILFVEWAGAQTIYKCQLNGRIQYSDVPCWQGYEVKRMAPDGGPTAEDRARARMRLDADLARQRDLDAASRQAQEDAVAARRLAPDQDERARSSEVADAYANEKVLTHGRSGWDRKARGQLAEEEKARAAARNQARAGSNYEPSPGASPSAGPARWESETSIVHGSEGWTEKSGREQVNDAGKSAYRRERAHMESERSSSIVNDQFGQPYFVTGGVAINQKTGKACNYNQSSRRVSC